MTVPAFLNSSFRYLNIASVTDVDTLISSFRSEVVTNGDPAWTEPSTGLFKSPVDANSRFFDVLLTRIDADTLEMRVRDWNGTTVGTRRMDIDAAGTICHIYSGEKHFHIEASRTSPEFVGGGMLDLTPEAQDAHTKTIYAYGFRTSAGAASNNDVGFWWIGSATEQHAGCLWKGNGQSGSQVYLVTAAGSYIFMPVEGADTATYRPIGRRYQQLVCSNGLAVGSEIQVPIDVGTTGTFKVLGIPHSYYEVIAMRKA